MESSKLRTETEEPLTPDTPSKDSGKKQSNNFVHAALLSAPRGKPKAPPLIQRKVKPNESGEDGSCFTSSSKIPLLKTKQTERECDFNKRFLPQNKLSYGHPQRNMSYSLQPNKIHSGSSQTADRMKTRARNIEMKRVVQEPTGVVPKRFSNAGLASNTSSMMNPIGRNKRMTKTETTFNGVKTYTSRNGYDTTFATASKPVGKNTSLKQKTNEEAKGINTVSGNTSKQVQNQPTSGLSLVNPDYFKTIDDFLKMPETALPESKGSSNTSGKKTFYKSKFWEYIDPNAKLHNEPKCNLKESKRRYDPHELKTFMQKQKEARKLQQVRESKEKKLESDRRNKMLKELDSKCQRLALKPKQKIETQSVGSESETTVDGINPAKKRKLELESPSLKYLKPLLEHKHGALFRKSDILRADTAKQAKYLLAEFENIVKRECINFLQKMPIPTTADANVGAAGVSPSIIERFDKSVGTSLSVTDQNQELKVAEEQHKACGEIKLRNAPSPDKIERAVVTIQSHYRAYTVRRQLKEAKLNLRKPWVNGDDQFQSRGRPSRRWSFPRPPEKPYDASSRLLPMSPIPMAGAGTDCGIIPGYIPPPPPSRLNQTCKSPPRPKVLPSSPFTPVRHRMYDEPYPKQLKRGESFSSITNPSSLGLGFNEFVIPSPLPSVVDVLCEKIRLFSASATATTVPPDSGRSETQSHHHHEQQQTCTGKESDVHDKGTISNEISCHEANNQSTSHSQYEDEERCSQDYDVTPKSTKRKKHKHHSRTRPCSRRRSSSPIGNSTTTVETDLESSSKVRHSQSSTSVSQKPTSATDVSTSKSEGFLPSVTEPSGTSSSLGDFVAPALRLQYEAEKEHLKIIEKALHIKLNARPSVEHAMNSTETPKKKHSQDSERVQLAIANCNKESMKAAAEMAKWMADFQKTAQQQTEKTQIQKTPSDLAAMVHAAVEEARIMGEEKRKERERVLRAQKVYDFRVGLATSQPPSQELDHAAESQEKLLSDARVETCEGNGNIVNNSNVDKLKLDKNVKDYQQQFPSASESERDSPIPSSRNSGNVASASGNISLLLNVDSHSDTNQEEINTSPAVSEKAESHDVDVQLVSPPPSSSSTSTFKSASVPLEEYSVESQPSLSPGSDPIELPSEVLTEKQTLTVPASDHGSQSFSRTDEIEEPNSESGIKSICEEKSEIDSAEKVSVQEISLHSLEKPEDILSEVQFTSFESETPKTEDDGQFEPEIDISLKPTPPYSPSSSSESTSLSSRSLIIPHENEKISGDHSDSNKDEINTGPVVSEISENSKSHDVDVQIISPPPSSSNALKSASVPLEECVVELPSHSQGTDQVELPSEVLTEKQDLTVPTSDGSQSFPGSDKIEGPKSDSEPEHDSIVEEKSKIDSTEEGSVVKLNSSQPLQLSKPADVLSEVQPPTVLTNDVSQRIPESDKIEGPDSESEVKSISEEKSDIDSAEEVSGQLSQPLELSKPEDILSEVQPLTVLTSDSSQSLPESDKIEEPNSESEIKSVCEDKSEINAAEEVDVQLNSSKPLEKPEGILSEVQLTRLHTETQNTEQTTNENVQFEPELDIPLKPPPPYSPSSSLESTSLSSRSLIISLENDRIERVVHEQASLIWECWRHNEGSGDSFPNFDAVIKINERISESNIISAQMESHNRNPELTQSAVLNFNILLNHLVYETIKEVLQIRNPFTSYVEQVRPGPLALQAQSMKTPKTKESLISSVIKRVKHAIPSSFFAEPYVPLSDKYRGKKWSTRPRELVDEILLDELVEEDYQWTEWWPEKVIIMESETERVIKQMIGNALKNHQYVYSQ